MSLNLGTIVADFTTTLATALSVGGTTATLTSATDDDGVALPTGTYYLTIDGSNSSKEHIVCTLTGTSLTAIQSVSRQGALTTGVVRAHRIGASVVLTDHAVLKSFQDVLTTGYATAVTPASDYQLATKKYVDDTAAGGTVSVDKVSVVGTAGESVVAGNLLYLKTSDSKWWKCDADTVTTLDNVVLGIAQGTGSADGLISGGVLVKGVDANQTGLTANSIYYASNTAGGISLTSGTNTRVVGIATSTTQLYFDPEFNKTYKDYAVDSAGTDSYAITLQSAFGAYYAGMEVSFKAGTANTGACTLNVNGLGAKTIKKDVSTDLATGDILANQIVTVKYDGTNFQMVSLSSGLATTTSATTAKLYTVGALDNTLAKTYFNIILPFTLWTGSVVNDTSSDFVNWSRNSADANVYPGGAMTSFTGTGSDYISLSSFMLRTRGENMKWDATNTVILDWWANLNATGTGDISMGFGSDNSAFTIDYNDNTVSSSRVMFNLSSAGNLYATMGKISVGITNTDITSGVTVTNWNNYRIELDLGTDAKFYVNGVLKATLSGANLYTGTQEVYIGFGRSSTASFIVTAPTLSLEMNP